MTVKVKILPQKYEFNLEVDREISLDDFLSMILKSPIAKILPPGMVIIVNGLPANSPSFKIKPGDNVVLLPPISGGGFSDIILFKDKITSLSFHASNKFYSMLPEYYSRQISLPELGINGQRKLKESRVAIVGIGGLGSIAALYLTLAGIGYIKIIDQDILEVHNIHRQVLYNIKQIGYPKVEVAAERLREANPDVYIEPIPENLNVLNAEKLIGDVDVVIDGLDNMSTRYIINRICIKNKIPYVFGGAIGFEGNVSVFKPPETPCLECVFPSIDDKYLPTCETRGVIGATTGIIGAIEAMETLKILADINSSLKGRLLVCDFKDMDFSTINLSKRLNCPACSGEAELKQFRLKTTWICGGKTVNVNPTTPLNISIEEIYDKIKMRFKVNLKSAMMIALKYNGDVEVSIFRGGRMLIKNVNDEEQALHIYEDLIKLLR